MSLLTATKDSENFEADKMSDALEEILRKCNLLEHYDYLRENGFDSWDALQCLEKDDFNQLKDIPIPYGAFLKLLKAINQHAAKVDRGEYESLYAALQNVPDPESTFSNIDGQIAQYQHLKAQYRKMKRQIREHQAKLSEFIQSTDDTVPLSKEKVQQNITSIWEFDESFNTFLQRMGDVEWNPNPERIDLTGSIVKGESAHDESTDSSLDNRCVHYGIKKLLHMWTVHSAP